MHVVALFCESRGNDLCRTVRNYENASISESIEVREAIIRTRLSSVVVGRDANMAHVIERERDEHD